jgi:hypothetical protein
MVTHELTTISHIICQNNGKLSVSISREDYHMYKKAYSFDQLCASLGSVFDRFLKYYKEGSQERIINELRAAN